MKKSIGFLMGAALALMTVTAAGAGSKASGDKLESGFVTPPDSILTSVYWYWISGNISKEGVIKDLEAMKEAGINRAFIGNIWIGDLATPYKTVKVFSEDWWEITAAALKRAGELGIEIGMFNCPGWSQAGGPWIRPDQAMRYLTSSKTKISGGRKVCISLPKPASDFQDVRVIAYPDPEAGIHNVCQANSVITAEGVNGRPETVSDGDLTTEVLFDGSGIATFDFNCEEEVSLRNITIWPSASPIRADVEFQVMKNGRFEKLSSFSIDRSNPNIEVGFDAFAPVSIAIDNAQGKEFRVIVKGAGQGNGFREIRLSEIPYVERYPEKTLSKMFQSPLPYWHEYQWRDQPGAKDGTLSVNPSEVIDISGHFDGNTLVWDAPEGNWTVMRTGMRPIQIVNSPAAEEGTGLEIDKMSSVHLRHHFDNFIGEIMRRIPAENRKSLKIIVSDSYEKGGQNFTDTFFEDFKEAYGYDPLPFLPVYDGATVGSPEISDRFLWDMRRMAADKLAYTHIGGLRKIANSHGLKLWLENYGHWGFMGEFLQYGGQSDEVSGEFWGEGSLGDIENRAASSCAHIYGKNRVSAESFTSAGNDFGRYPEQMKPRGDRFFAEGINNSLLHVYIAQPGDEVPGMNAWFGTEFNRNNTWFSHIDLFTDYLKRVNFMLQQGLNIADVAYFIGEDTPKMTGVTDPPLPEGYQFDYINAEVLLDSAYIDDGMWTLPHGTRYRILVLPKQTTMRPELLEKLSRMVAEGGILLGPAPMRSPSLKGHIQADARVRSLAAELWGDIDGKTVKTHKYGKGTVIDGMTMEEALDFIGCPPDLATAGDVPVAYGHRSDNQTDIYFLTNQSSERIDFPCSFRISGKAPQAWDAVSGEIRPLPQYSDNGQITTLPMALEAGQSIFVVFRNGKKDKAKTRNGSNFPGTEIVMNLRGPWTLEFQEGRGGPENPVVMEHLQDLSLSSDESIRYFSGSVTYRTSFEMEPVNMKERLFLDTGKVGIMAKVYVNGKYAGGIWTAPHRVDITDFIQSGNNEVTIEVVNTWVNRLIGDSRLPQEERITWTYNNPWRPDSRLQRSGLFNPVRIVRER